MQKPTLLITGSKVPGITIRYGQTNPGIARREI
jgi:hypothetical protein